MHLTLISGIGYAASLMVAVSLAMKKIVSLRVFNFIGCILFVFYGVMIQSWPVVITNGFIAVINIWYLFKIKKQSDQT